LKTRAPGLGAQATATFRNADDRRLNNPTPENPQDVIAGIADGSDDDRAWFARHPGRSHRIRTAVGAERLMGEPKRGFRPMVAIRQLAPGERIRAPFGWRKSTPLLNSEATAARMFQVASESRPKHVIASAWRLEREP
jgi:hypothetical protein